MELHAIRIETHYLFYLVSVPIPTQQVGPHCIDAASDSHHGLASVLTQLSAVSYSYKDMAGLSDCVGGGWGTLMGNPESERGREKGAGEKRRASTAMS